MRWRRHRARVMFVTGGSGFLGRHLTRSVESGQWEVVAPSSRAMDIRRRDGVVDTITGWRPQVVAHLAYRRDDRRTIVDGSRNVAEAAQVCGARLIHISSDVVFGGRPRPYSELDPPTPVNDYGRWKTEAETAVLSACPTAAVVRTSLLYGTDNVGDPQLQVERALRAGEPMTFFTDEVRCPAHASEVAAAIARLADQRDITGVLHVAGPTAFSRAEFAALIACWLGLDATALRTAQSDGTRPGHVVLDSSRAASFGITCRSPHDWLR